jgi:hypothetical protein
MSDSTSFILRKDLIQMATDYLMSKFYSEIEYYNNLGNLKRGHIAPTFPTQEQILNLADSYNDFVSGFKTTNTNSTSSKLTYPPGA